MTTQAHIINRAVVLFSRMRGPAQDRQHKLSHEQCNWTAFLTLILKAVLPQNNVAPSRFSSFAPSLSSLLSSLGPPLSRLPSPYLHSPLPYSSHHRLPDYWNARAIWWNWIGFNVHWTNRIIIMGLEMRSQGSAPSLGYWEACTFGLLIHTT